jgi:hypothetical protein
VDKLSTGLSLLLFLLRLGGGREGTNTNILAKALGKISLASLKKRTTPMTVRVVHVTP